MDYPPYGYLNGQPYVLVDGEPVITSNARRLPSKPVRILTRLVDRLAAWRDGFHVIALLVVMVLCCIAAPDAHAGVLPPNSPIPGTTHDLPIAHPVPPVVVNPNPRICQYDVIGRRLRVIDVGLSLGVRWPAGSAVIVEVYKGTAAWAQVAHPQAGTSFVRFIAPFDGGAGSKHRVTIVWANGQTLRCGRT